MRDKIERRARKVSWRVWLLPSPTSGHPFGMRRVFWPLLMGLVYVVGNALLGGLKGDHVFIASLSLLDLYNHKSRQFLRRFFPFIVTGVLFDSMRYYYWPLIEGRIHISEPYYRDLAWFGIPIESGAITKWVTPNEYFQLNRNVWLDLLCGFAYLTFVGEYLAVAFYLFFREQFRTLRAYGLCFFFVNLLGYVTYFAYPAAPPWYVSLYQFEEATKNVRPFAAGAARFDELLGTRFFDGVYSRGTNAFGAYPSLHVAYPLLVVWICFYREDLKWARVPSVLFYLVMCLSAVYLNHHYVVDIALGSSYAVVVAGATTILLRRRPMTAEGVPAAR